MKIVAGVALSLACACFISSQTSALAATADCSDNIELVLARGSGQVLSDDKHNVEMSTFTKEVASILSKSSLKAHVYHLGTETYNKNKYPAVDVADVRNGNAIGAKLSSGFGNDYGKSVNSGIEELKEYLKQRRAKCPDARFILAGISQGAQVVGQALSNDVPQETLDHIDHVALFGDPKLWLPEGLGYFPPACSGKQYSPWRRDVGNCFTSQGALGARKPYVGGGLPARVVGSWCNARDYICGSSMNPLTISGHGEYAATGGPVTKAANEAVRRIDFVSSAKTAAQKLTAEKANAAVHDALKKTGQGSAGVDMMFVLDVTGSMSSSIKEAKQFIRDSAAKIHAMNGRVGLTIYRDSTDYLKAEVVSDLQADTTDMLAKLDKATAAGGYDYEEAALFALKTAFNNSHWRNGATKAAVLITDAPYHDPDKVDKTSLADIVKRSLEIDPVNIYAVTPSEQVGSAYTAMTDQTAGKVIIGTNTADALIQTLDNISSRPVVQLANTDYAVLPGVELRFDASQSYVYDAEITRYDWDFDGNGTYDQTTSSPIVDHTYDANFNGYMQVRATASNGTVGSASAKIAIGPIAAEPRLTAPVAVSAEKVGANSLKFTWRSTDSRTERWYVRLRDDPTAGYTEASQTYLTITDVDTTKPFKFSVQGVSASVSAGSAFTEIVYEPATTTVTGATTSDNNSSGKNSHASVAENKKSDEPNSPIANFLSIVAPQEIVENLAKNAANVTSKTAGVWPFIIASTAIVACAAAGIMVRRFYARAVHTKNS